MGRSVDIGTYNSNPSLHIRMSSSPTENDDSMAHLKFHYPLRRLALLCESTLTWSILGILHYNGVLFLTTCF